MTNPTQPIGSTPRPLALTKAIGDSAQAIIGTVQHPLVLLDDKLRVTTANESFYQTFHVLPAEAEGQLIYDLGARQWDIPKLRTLLEEILLESGQFHDFEIEHEFENIGPKRMLLNARRLDQPGDCSQLILAIQDITERKHAEESLLENEERYRTLFNLSPVAVYTIDASGVILEFNRPAAELWGREPAMGDTDQRFCGSFKMFRPDGSFMPHEQCPMAEVVSGKVSSVHDGEVHIERPDGSHVTVIVNIRPLKNDRGEVTGAINCFYDITERKQAETLILFQKEAFEMAASGASLEQVLEFLARTAESQSSQGALIAIHLLDATGTRFDQTFAPSLPASYAQATNGMEVNSATAPCCAAIARRMCVAVVSVASSEEFPGFAGFALPLGIQAGWSMPMFSSTGKVIGAFASYYREPREPNAQDNLLGEVLTRTASVIAERKRAEEELENLMRKEQAARAEAEAANRVKDEFLAIVSHELRTPLNAIVGWTHLLKNGKLGQVESERAIQTIDRNATAQAAIISELLDVSRIISGKLKLDMKPVDLADVIKEAVDVVRAAADAKGIEVVTSIDQKAGLVAGESVRLQQVIWNLLTNAIKFTPKGGSVKVQLERADSHVAVAVSDSGAGIPPDFLPHVFERFQQADTSEKRTHGGLGLGLSIVRNLVEMHGGCVSAESKGEGLGARFTVTLPILAVSGSSNFLQASRDASSELPAYGKAQQAGPAEEQDMDLKPDFLSGIKVLAVDDQADTRDLIILALSQYGAEVRTCTSAIEACKMIQHWKPGVIVSDIGMPNEDGYDLMQSIRALARESGGQTPAIALTGYASSADELKAYAAGYQVHLTKPVEIRELARIIAKLSGRQSTTT